MDCMNRATLPKALVFLPMHDLAVFNKQDISTASKDKSSSNVLEETL